MRWISFAILVYVVTCLQSAAAPFVAVHSIRPDLMVIIAVHYALAARTYDGMLACWFIGLAIDLSGISYQEHANVGIHALSLALIAWVVIKLRSFTFRESVLTQLLFTFSVKLILAILVGMHMMYAIGDWDRFGDIVSRGIYAAAYTAILAPYGHWMLRRLRTVLGIGVTHRVRVR